jgi:phosphomannomutase
MTLPKLTPLPLSTSNPSMVKEYHFNITLAKKTGTNGPRDLYTAYPNDFFEKYCAAYATIIKDDLVVGYDGSRFHESLLKGACEYLRRLGISVSILDKPVTVPEFMFSCYKRQKPGCFFGRSHSPQEYIGMKLVLHNGHLLTLLKELGAKVPSEKAFKKNEIYGFLPRTVAPIIEQEMKEYYTKHPKKIGTKEIINTKEMREQFIDSLKKITPLEKLQGEYIVDCRHSTAGEVWKIIEQETDIQLTLHNDKLDPIAPNRDPREIWPKLTKKYSKKKEAVFNHDGDADRTFLVKTPGIGKENIIENQEEVFTTGIIAAARDRKPEEFILVQERVSLIMLGALKEFTNNVHITAQGEPSFFMGLTELLLKKPTLKTVVGADYTDIYYNKSHPICMKSPFQQAIWLMYWFMEQPSLPDFPAVAHLKTTIPMIDYDYPQRLEKVLGTRQEITNYLESQYQIMYQSMLDGQHFLVKDSDGNKIVISIRPSGTGRYTKVISDVGLGPAKTRKREQISQQINQGIAQLLE